MITPVSEKQQFYAVSESLDVLGWDLDAAGPVDLCLGDTRLRMRYVGYGLLHRTQPAREVILQLHLEPSDPTFESFERVRKLLEGGQDERMSLERAGRVKQPGSTGRSARVRRPA
jgi:hypothetical protein